MWRESTNPKQVLINKIILNRNNEEKILIHRTYRPDAGCLYGTGYRRTAVHPHRRGTEVRLPADVNSGELLIKFKPEMTDILDRTMTRAAGNGGVMTRSGIPSTDEVLEILGGYHLNVSSR